MENQQLVLLREMEMNREEDRGGKRERGGGEGERKEGEKERKRRGRRIEIGIHGKRHLILVSSWL